MDFDGERGKLLNPGNPVRRSVAADTWHCRNECTARTVSEAGTAEECSFLASDGGGLNDSNSEL
jgi:hypothetical protein